jgi:hypothetical protein
MRCAWLAFLVLAGCMPTPDFSPLDALDDEHPAAFLGTWRQASTLASSGGERWSLRESGQARHQADAQDDAPELDESCGWGVAGDVLSLRCGDDLKQGRARIDDDELRLGVLERSDELAEESLISDEQSGPAWAAWRGQIVRNAPDELRDLGPTFVGEQDELRLYPGYTLRGVRRVSSGSCVVSYYIIDGRCFVDDGGELACFFISHAEPPAEQSYEALREHGPAELRAPIDLTSGLPRFEGLAITDERWLRM